MCVCVRAQRKRVVFFAFVTTGDTVSFKVAIVSLTYSPFVKPSSALRHKAAEVKQKKQLKENKTSKIKEKSFSRFRSAISSAYHNNNSVGKFRSFQLFLGSYKRRGTNVHFVAFKYNI